MADHTRPDDSPDAPLHSQPHREPAWEPKKGENLLSRRGFIKGVVGIAIGGALVGGTMAQLLPTIAPAGLGGGGIGPIIFRDPKTNAKQPVTLADLAGTPPIQRTAEYNFLPATIFKVKKSLLEASSKKRGYNTAEFAVEMPGEPENVIMVYEAKCKHLGCTVGWNAGLGGSKDISDYNEDGVNDGRILCPCHQGQYDIYDLANNVPGTPPPSPLNVVEFDVTSWTNEETSESFSNVLLGRGKAEQGSSRAASGKSTIALPTDMFTIRQAGWSE